MYRPLALHTRATTRDKTCLFFFKFQTKSIGEDRSAAALAVS